MLLISHRSHKNFSFYSPLRFSLCQNWSNNTQENLDCAWKANRVNTGIKGPFFAVCCLCVTRGENQKDFFFSLQIPLLSVIVMLIHNMWAWMYLNAAESFIHWDICSQSVWTGQTLLVPDISCSISGQIIVKSNEGRFPWVQSKMESGN